MTEKRELDYKNIWELMKQMVDYYTEEKKYLTRREIKYIIRTCENKNSRVIPIKKESIGEEGNSARGSAAEEDVFTELNPEEMDA